MRGRADADRIAERDFVTAKRDKRLGHRRHLIGRDRAVIGAAGNAGNVTAYEDVSPARRLRNMAQALEAFGARAAYIVLAKAFGGGHKTAISVTPASMAASKPFILGTSTG